MMDHTAHDMAEQRVPTKAGSASVAKSQESPRKKKKRTGITLSQKQAVIDNLQLEVTERARKLRAQYNLQAQGLRTRIEIRVNRIPMALRKSKIRDLVEKHESGLQQSSRTPAPVYDPFSAPSSSKPPPVPEKDEKHLSRPVSQRSAASNTTGASRPGSGRPPKRTSDQISGTNKENEQDNTEGPKKRLRGHPAPDDDTRKALSPASSNTRLVPQSSPGKSKPHTARPSPQKNNSASNILSNLAEKARSTRVAHTSRKMNTSTSTASTSASTSASGTLRTRRGAAGTAPTKATTTRTARKVSGISESSDGSTSTVIKKSTARGGTATKAAAPAAAAKRTVMGTIRRGVTGGTGTTKKTPVAKSAPASTATGRVLRKRNN